MDQAITETAQTKLSIALTESILTKLSYQVMRNQALPEIQNGLQTQVNQIIQKTHEVLRDISQKETAKLFYQKAVDAMYEESKGELEKAITMALQFVFYDKKFSCRIILGDQRGKSMEYVIFDESDPENPVEVSLKEGTGKGIKSVVSFVSHVYYILSKGFPFLFVDEGYTGISEIYVERFFTFAKTFCETKGLILVLITQDPRFMAYGDKTYYVSDGVVTELREDEDENYSTK